MAKKGWIAGVFLLLLSCGEKADVEDYIREGERYLRIGEPDPAREAFLKAVNIEKENCAGNYGLLLSDLLSLASFLPMASSMMGMISPQSGVDTLATQLFTTLEGLVGRIQNSVKVIEDKKCTYTFYSLPVTTGSTMLLLMGEWGQGEAQLIGGIADILAGGLHLLLSMNYEFDIEKFLDALQGKYRSYEQLFEDPVGLLRFFGYIPFISRDFLTVSDARKEFFQQGRNELASGLTRLQKGIQTIFSPSQDKCPYDNIIMWLDNDGSGDLSQGDFVDIRAYRYDPAGWKDAPKDEKWKFMPEPYEEWKCDGKKILRGCFHLMGDMCLEDEMVQLVLTSVLTADYLERVTTFLSDLSNAISRRYPEPFTIGRINEIIPARESLQGLLELLGVSSVEIEVKNTMRFNFSEFFKEPRALRDFLPYWYDEDRDGYAEFLIEGESLSLKSRYVKSSDSSHFPDTITFEREEVKVKIEKDCLSPEKDEMIPLIYIAFRDPSFGGLLEVNLTPLPPCSSDPVYEWTKPEGDKGIYMTNRVLNDLIKKINGLLKALGGITGG